MMMKMKSVAAAAVTTVLLLLVVEECSAFSVIPKASVTAGRRSRLAVALTAVKGNNSDNLNSDFPPEEETAEYTGSVDWDAEWKKVVKNGGVANSGDRPGKEFYKSEAEIAAIRAANKATEEAAKLASQIPSIPSFDTLKGDWKFWIGLLAIISFGTALLSAQAPMPTTGNPDSYYI